MHACMLGHFSCVRLFVTLQTVARKAPLSIGFSRQEYWSGLPCPPPGDLHQGSNLYLVTPALAGRFFNTWEAATNYNFVFYLWTLSLHSDVSSMRVGILTVLFTAVSLVSRAVPGTQWVFSKSLLDE
ncbi:unnamed protein product [Rangifer tarandus platyrhynchus]|uniref:Uncharacterized protein n=1 Tax=Rangifer tarandus platyrhynchus TaxID=3082113 RepID=A0ABN8XQ73_RANTA|nr:unnamed protein product [Rangifer tarandus platyrhynchus]